MSQNPLISIVIPARVQNCQLLIGILQCLEKQTLQDFEVLIVCDRFFSQIDWDILKYFLNIKIKKALKVRLFSHLNSNFVPKSIWGASYVRNFGIKHAKGDFIQLFDDDNRFDPDYIQKALDHYKTQKEHFQTEVIITPTLYYKNTPQIQNQGFSNYNYRLARPKIHFLKTEQKYAQIQMFSGNWIFWRAELLKSTLYDEQIARIAEDLDFTYRLQKSNKKEKKTKILTFSDLKVYHFEREKTILEQARIWNPTSAEQKIKNIFLRHKKHAHWIQLLIFILRSSRGISLWLSIKALRYWNNQKFSIIKAIWLGYLKGRKILIP